MAPAAAIPKPIPLITFEYADINKSLDEGRFAVNPEAVAQLAQLPRPLHVVTIAGLYRTGKSFVLNQLAGFTDGFNIGASVGASCPAGGPAPSALTARTMQCAPAPAPALAPPRAHPRPQSRAQRASGCGWSTRKRQT